MRARARRRAASSCPRERVVRLGIGAAEAVDRLLRIADDDRLALDVARRRVARQAVDDLRLRPIGVLKLVDEDVVELRARALAARFDRRARSCVRSRRSSKSTTPSLRFSSSRNADEAARQRMQQRHRRAMRRRGGRRSSCRCLVRRAGRAARCLTLALLRSRQIDRRGSRCAIGREVVDPRRRSSLPRGGDDARAR